MYTHKYGIYLDADLICSKANNYPKNKVNGAYHNGRVAAYGPGDPGLNQGKDQYIIKFK